MSPTAPAVQGACPSVHRPFHQLDGELLRVRLPGGRLAGAQARTLCRAAPAASIELTGRANLQLRGLDPGVVPALTAELVAAGLVHPDPDVDERRNVLVSPTAGFDPDEILDVTPTVGAVVDTLAAAGQLRLPPTFAVLLDGGGSVHLRGRPAALCLGAVRTAPGSVAFEVVLGGPLPLGPRRPGPVALVAVDHVSRLVEAVVRRSGQADLDDLAALGILRLAQLPAGDLASTPSRAPIGILPGRPGRLVAVGVMPFLGRLRPPELAALAGLAERWGSGELRLGPWRSFLIPGVAEPGPLLDGAAALGLVTDGQDPAVGVVACAGTSGCPAALTDAQADARAVVEDLRQAGVLSRVHVSACDKRCAGRRPDEHDLTFVGGPEAGTYRVYGHRSRLLEEGLAARQAGPVATRLAFVQGPPEPDR